MAKPETNGATVAEQPVPFQELANLLATNEAMKSAADAISNHVPDWYKVWRQFNDRFISLPFNKGVIIGSVAEVIVEQALQQHINHTRALSTRFLRPKREPGFSQNKNLALQRDKYGVGINLLEFRRSKPRRRVRSHRIRQYDSILLCEKVLTIVECRASWGHGKNTVQGMFRQKYIADKIESLTSFFESKDPVGFVSVVPEKIHESGENRQRFLQAGGLIAYLPVTHEELIEQVRDQFWQMP